MFKVDDQVPSLAIGGRIKYNARDQAREERGEHKHLEEGMLRSTGAHDTLVVPQNIGVLQQTLVGK